ncbi:hypothetical protein LQH37_004270 [Salmonella enterica]|nr:hypothetical protein [Salmonella enterica]
MEAGQRIYLVTARKHPAGHLRIAAAVIPVPAGGLAIKKCFINAAFHTLFIGFCRYPVQGTVHDGKSFDNQTGLLEFLGKLDDRITVIRGKILRTREPFIQQGEFHAGLGIPQLMFVVPGNRFLSIDRRVGIAGELALIRRHGKPGSVTGFHVSTP